ncbi:MAG: hypothetical protein HS116_06080 [Planctomycetes bacterium]|nr:hypothetical protein [Planctomycetota bacterium]
MIQKLGTPSEAPAGALRGTLARARRIWRMSAGICRALLWFAATLAALLVLALADNLFDLPSVLRLGLGVLAAGASMGALCAWVARPAFWRINDQAAAVYLEQKLGQRDNLLINAVQLNARTASASVGGSNEMIRQIVMDAGTRARELALGGLWERRRLRIVAGASAGALGALALYASVWPDYAANALWRYTQPLAGIPRISRTRVLARPAERVEVLAGERLTVHGLAAMREGEAPREMALCVELPEGPRRIPMSPAPQPNAELIAAAGSPAHAAGFVYDFPNVNESFRFTLESGDGVSLPCEVQVRAKPRPTEPELELAPPAYTGLEAQTEPAPAGLVHALPGTRATLRFGASIPLKEGEWAGPGGRAPLQAAGARWSVAWNVEQEGAYALTLVSKDGARAERAFEGQILLRADARPAVYFENKSPNVPALPGGTVPLALRAQDDYGLKSIRLVARRADERNPQESAGWTLLKQWSFPVPGEKSIAEVYALKLDPAQFVVGAAYAVVAEAADHAPGADRVTRSAPLIVRILTPEQMGLQADSPFRTVFEQIQKLIELQTQARGKTVTVGEFLEEVAKSGALGKRLASIRDDQSVIRNETAKLTAQVESAFPKERAAQTAPLVRELRALHDGPMDRAVQRLVGGEQVSGAGATTIDLLQTERELQDEILNRLTALLGSLGDLDREPTKAKIDLKDEQAGKRLREKLEATQDKLKDFLDQQKKVLESTEELAKKNPDDLTEEDKKKLGELAQAEADWAKYFREAFTDLSKVPDQDFSNSGLAEEFNEVFQEIQKASEALQNKKTEIAVRNEEAGLELAKQLETNLEKWLPDTKDTEKWSMEEPQGEFDVPLADLPKELEDIIGELLDDAEEMADDVEDVSSSFMDSMDKGAGWDAADGNISNMSAKGVTGNRLPNEHEVGGRSGEGRGGKSSGQFVEQTADGKGGRQTPSRVTPDPFEAGQVDDKSQDAVGGATGGGKESGVAGQGLRGEPPPETKEKLQRLQGQQAQLRQQAEKIQTQLKAYHLPSSDMAEAIRRMNKIEEQLQAGRGFNLRQAHSQLLDQLKDAKQAVGYKAEIDLERSRELPKHVREKILSGMQAPSPQGYQDLLEAYYKALVETDE